MVFNLTYDSKWNYKCYPFLLLRYKKVDAVKDYDNHKYNIISREDYECLFNKHRIKFEWVFNNAHEVKNAKKTKGASK